MELKKITTLGCALLLSACTTARYNPETVSTCTGLDILKVNGFDKQSHLFNKNDSYYIKRYAPHTAYEDIKLTGCKKQINGEKRVNLKDPSSNIQLRYGSYTPENQQLFDLFIKLASQSQPISQQNIDETNQLIHNLKTTYSTAPKKEADWYIDTELSTNQLVLVSNARNNRLYGLMSNRTLALTKSDALLINELMDKYWKN